MRGYYGAVNHNVKAVYQRYLGWFDGNPANLHALPPVESATRGVEWMGGADAVLDRARTVLGRRPPGAGPEATSSGPIVTTGAGGRSP